MIQIVTRVRCRSRKHQVLYEKCRPDCGRSVSAAASGRACEYTRDRSAAELRGDGTGAPFAERNRATRGLGTPGIALQNSGRKAWRSLRDVPPRSAWAWPDLLAGAYVGDLRLMLQVECGLVPPSCGSAETGSALSSEPVSDHRRPGLDTPGRSAALGGRLGYR